MIDLGGGPQALPAVEIVPGEGGYDYSARYTAGKTEFYVPARLPAEVAGEVARIAITAHSVLGPARPVQDRPHRRRARAPPYFLEVNVSPGMTETSTLPLALEASGHSFGSTCVSLLELGGHPRRLGSRLGLLGRAYSPLGLRSNCSIRLPAFTRLGLRATSSLGTPVMEIGVTLRDFRSRI